MCTKLHRRVLDALKKRKRPAEDREPSPEPQQPVPKIPGRQARPPTTGRRRARLHHYFFAHRVLRDAFFEAPHEFVAALLTRRDELLELIWKDVGDWAVEQEGEEARLPSEGLALTVREIDPLTLALVVSLPAPEHQTEAHFVGMIVGPKGVADYLTLERTRAGFGPPTGVFLCEWSKSGMHAIMRPSPEPTLDAFAEALSNMVKRTG